MNKAGVHIISGPKWYPRTQTQYGALTLGHARTSHARGPTTPLIVIVPTHKPFGQWVNHNDSSG